MLSRCITGISTYKCNPRFALKPVGKGGGGSESSIGGHPGYSAWVPGTSPYTTSVAGNEIIERDDLE